MGNGKFLFYAGKLKETQNEIYEQSTKLFDLLFHLQCKVAGSGSSGIYGRSAGLVGGSLSTGGKTAGNRSSVFSGRRKGAAL